MESVPLCAPDRGRKIRILVADDHRLVRQGIANLLNVERDVEVVGEADDGEMAIQLVDRYAPDVVIMDVNMPRMNGIDATRVIRQRYPTVRVIGMSMYEQSEMAERMRGAGAAEYVAKDSPVDELIRAIREVACRSRGV